MKKRWIKRVLIVVPIVIAAIALFGFFVEALWNALLPHLFGWPSITWLQGVGLLVLCKILFGGFRGRPGMHWRHRMQERWAAMTPEEREKFRRGMEERCGRMPSPAGPQA